MVRIGIIGMGNMGRGHVDYLLKNKIKNCKLVAICDLIKPQDPLYEDLKFYFDYKELIRSGEIDAVIVATPHYSHTYIGAYALEHNIHTLVEKPISVHVNDCMKLINAHKNTVFSAMFNQRTRPPHIKLKEIIPELGKIQRITCICTNWYRTQAYYNSSPWRATWSGEGGGILLNQCPHQLDLIQWLAGMPKEIYAHISLGKYHNIEVEDEVISFWTYEDGKICTFIGSTGEFPGTERLEFEGEFGKVVFEENKIRYWKNNVSSIEYANIHNEKKIGEPKAKTSANYFNTPKTNYEEYEFKEDIYFLNQHAIITQNFVNAIEYGEKLISSGEEGIKSVELANAMILSGIKNKKVSLPLDPMEYENLLNELKG